MRQFLADNLAVARLTTIRRQQDPDLRRAVELAASERIREAIDLLTEQNRVTPLRTRRNVTSESPPTTCRPSRPGNAASWCHPPTTNATPLITPSGRRSVAHHYVASLGPEHQILIRRDLTPAQLRDARSSHEGDVLYFRRGSKRRQIPKGAYLTVGAVNDTSLTLTGENGCRFEFDPSTLKGVHAYSTESRTIAVGDRLHWREPDNQRRIANGEYPTITKLDQRQIEVHLDKGRKLSMPLAEARKLISAMPLPPMPPRARPWTASSSPSIPAAAPSWSTTGCVMSRSRELASTPASILTTGNACGGRSLELNKSNLPSTQSKSPTATA